jgi:diacylglycerol kinase family enzyme
MRLPIPVFVNRSGGTAGKFSDKLTGELCNAFAEAGAKICIQLLEGDDLGPALKAVVGAPVVVVGGGDGTQGSAAARLADTDSALGILPLGTLNHLARQLEIPLDLPGAAAVAVSGRQIHIDLGQVGHTVFVNNASIGLYTSMVRKREASRLPKWLATLPAALTVLRDMKVRPLQIDWGEGSREIVTPLLFIGNKRYALDGLRIGKRNALDEGILSVFAVRYRGRFRLLLFALRVLVGRADPAHDFTALSETGRLTVQGSGSLAVAHDGEIDQMDLPLTFEVRPKALAVMVPIVP